MSLEAEAAVEAAAEVEAEVAFAAAAASPQEAAWERTRLFQVSGGCPPGEA